MGFYEWVETPYGMIKTWHMDRHMCPRNPNNPDYVDETAHCCECLACQGKCSEQASTS